MSTARRTAGVGAAAMVAGVVLIIVCLAGGPRALIEHGEKAQVVIDFANSRTLKEGDDVRIDGVEVGEVTGVKSLGHRNAARVTARIDASAGTLYDDARAAVRWKTILGGGFYLALERGSRQAGRLAGPIPATRTTTQVELDDVTAVFDAGAVRGLRRIPPELARALRDTRAPSRLLGEIARQAPDITRGVEALRGRQADDLQRLVAASSRAVAALDRPDDDLSRLISGAGATLTTTARRTADLQEALRLAAPTMQTAQVSFARLRPVLRNARGLVTDLRDSAGDVAPALRRLRPVVMDALDLLDSARPLLARTLPTARSLAAVAPRATRLIDTLRPGLDRLSGRILPALNRVDPSTQRSTATMIGGTFSNMGAGVGGQMDANGHLIRFPATVGSSPVYSLPCQTYVNNPDKPSAIACQSLSEALKTYLSYDPLGPTPGVEPGTEKTRNRDR